jgi:hypothetical protein
MADIAHTNDKNHVSWDFRLIFAVAYLTLLVTFAFGRLFRIGRGTSASGSQGPRRSIFREAKVAAYAALPYAFKG